MSNHDFGHENMFFRKLCHKITYEDENNTYESINRSAYLRNIVSLQQLVLYSVL